MHQLYNRYCMKLRDTGKYRELLDRSLQNSVVNFSTNDYLLLSHRNELLLAALEAGKIYGVGATGSRLLSGNSRIFTEFEHRIAQDKGSESALIFNSGFQANFSVLSSLLDKSVLGSNPLVFFDRLNHSSLYQAVFLSGAELVRYQHNDMQHLADLLLKFQHDARPKFIVAETIFGMDGDILPIENIYSLAKKYNSFLYLDEAHATGLVGHNGYGLSTTINLKEIPHLIMGTFSKALGCSGSYIACSEILKNYLINKAPGFIYSTANSPMVIGAASKAWEMLPFFENERERLFALAGYLREELQKLGFNIGKSTSHIIPIILGEEGLVMQAKEKLFENNIIVSAIRPPTVPPGASRLRIALNISHSREEINRLIEVLKCL